MEILDWAEGNAEKLVQKYLDVQPNEVFSQNELKNKGDYYIGTESSGDGQTMFIDVCFGDEFEKHDNNLEKNYEYFTRYAEDISDNMNYDVTVMTNSDDQTIMFQFTDWFPEESEEPEEYYADGGKVDYYGDIDVEARKIYNPIGVNSDEEKQVSAFKRGFIWGRTQKKYDRDVAENEGIKQYKPVGFRNVDRKQAVAFWDGARFADSEKGKKMADGGKLPNGKTINGYDVHYFKTGRWVYANIEIPSPNPTFDDDTQIKGVGKDEKEAFNDLKKEFEKYLDRKKMAKGGELEDDTFVMLFKGYGFVEKRGSYGSKTFYNKEHNAYIYYDPKYKSLSGYVGGGEGNDEVITYTVEGVLDFFIEHDISESEATPLAKGGKVKNPAPDYPDFVSMQYEKGGYMAKLVPKMAKGGETNADRERMYNFLKDDLVTLQKSIEENNQEEIDKFFSYWNHHLNSLEPKMGSKRMYNFLKDDLVGLEAATKELPSSKEETDRFFSYWNTHLKSLSDEDLMNIMEYGGMMADGGDLAAEEVEITAEEFVRNLKSKGIKATKRTSKNGVFIYGENNGNGGYKYETYFSFSEVPDVEMLELEEYQFFKSHNKMAKGGTFDEKVNSIAKKLEGKPVPAPYRKEYGSRYDKNDAQEAARRIVGNMRKLYGE